MASEKWDPQNQSPSDPPPRAANRYNGMKGPPCSYCKHWNPQVTYKHTDTGYVAHGVRCCHAETMYHDFSCFTEEEDS